MVDDLDPTPADHAKGRVCDSLRAVHCVETLLADLKARGELLLERAPQMLDGDLRRELVQLTLRTGRRISDLHSVGALRPYDASWRHL